MFLIAINGCFHDWRGFGDGAGLGDGVGDGAGHVDGVEGFGDNNRHCSFIKFQYCRDLLLHVYSIAFL